MGYRGCQGFIRMARMPVLLALAVLVAGCSETSSVLTTARIGPDSGRLASLMPTTAPGLAFAPPAFYEFCERQPRLCTTTGSARTVSLTPALEKEMREVNLAVNRRIREQSDREALGKTDDWRLPSRVGDCEDFAILKKHELMKRGWPASSLLLTVVTSGGEGHVLLTVRTDRGDFVLDNRTNAVRDWQRAPYRFFARQSQTGHGKWDRIG
jgi:predicted transglutaminase-like cysteine proteinase